MCDVIIWFLPFAFVRRFVVFVLLHSLTINVDALAAFIARCWCFPLKHSLRTMIMAQYIRTYKPHTICEETKTTPKNRTENKGSTEMDYKDKEAGKRHKIFKYINLYCLYRTTHNTLTFAHSQHFRRANFLRNFSQNYFILFYSVFFCVFLLQAF